MVGLLRRGDHDQISLCTLWPLIFRYETCTYLHYHLKGFSRIPLDRSSCELPGRSHCHIVLGRSSKLFTLTDASSPNFSL